MYLLRMPKADENMAEGTVVRWLLAEGASVEEGQDVVECLADKGDFMVYAERGGVLRKVYALAQSVVPVGFVLAAIGDAAEPLPEVVPENAALMAKARERLAAGAGLTVRASARVRATPAARRAAREKGVQLADVAAGLGSRLVREEDVLAFARSRRAGRDESGGGA